VVSAFCADCQSGDEGLLDECGVAVRSVDQVTLLPPAVELGSAAAATPALTIVETVSDGDFVLAGDAACATSVGTASVTTHHAFVLDIHVSNSDVPDAPADPDFDKYFASFGFSRVRHLEEVGAARYPIPTTRFRRYRALRDVCVRSSRFQLRSGPP
jgi:hypothetical protein